MGYADMRGARAIRAFYYASAAARMLIRYVYAFAFILLPSFAHMIYNITFTLLLSTGQAMPLC